MGVRRWRRLLILRGHWSSSLACFACTVDTRFTIRGKILLERGVGRDAVGIIRGFYQGGERFKREAGRT